MPKGEAAMSPSLPSWKVASRFVSLTSMAGCCPMLPSQISGSPHPLVLKSRVALGSSARRSIRLCRPREWHGRMLLLCGVPAQNDRLQKCRCPVVNDPAIHDPDCGAQIGTEGEQDAGDRYAGKAEPQGQEIKNAEIGDKHTRSDDEKESLAAADHQQPGSRAEERLNDGGAAQNQQNLKMRCEFLIEECEDVPADEGDEQRSGKRNPETRKRQPA